MKELERVLIRALLDRRFLEELKKEDYDPGKDYKLSDMEKEVLKNLRLFQQGQGLDAVVKASGEAIASLLPPGGGRVENDRLGQMLERVAPKLERVAPKLERVAPKLERVAPKLERVAPKLERVTPKLDRVAPKLERVAPKLEQIGPKIERVAPKLERVAPKLERVQAKLERVQPKLESPAAASDPEKPKK
jgi:DNA repair ATPase RecN